MNERQFTTQVIKYARFNGWKAVHFRPARLKDEDGKERWATPGEGDIKGFPDIVAVRGERIVIAELKVSTDKTPEQQEWLNAFVMAGAETYTWRPDEWDEIEQVLGR